MLYWALRFLMIALVAVVLAFSGIAVVVIDIARIVLLAFWATFLATLVLGSTRR
jgi:uncharacterized membrane protein YtjA (UPF0391 family)